MNNRELIAAIVADMNIPKHVAERFVHAFAHRVGVQLNAGDEVEVFGLGKFTIAERAARTGRNPATGEPVEIPATRVAKFKPAKPLRDRLNPPQPERAGPPTPRAGA